jgi:hypothetical protein
MTSMKDHQAARTNILCLECRFYQAYKLDTSTGKPRKEDTGSARHIMAGGREYPGINLCRHPSAVTTATRWFGTQEHQQDPQDKNAHNDCPDFQGRRWRDSWRELLLGAGLLGLLLWSFLGCAGLHAPTDRPHAQELRVLDSWDTAYVKAQHACLAVQLTIATNQDVAHSFTCQRPTGERITVVALPGPLYRAVRFIGSPAHDVSDLVAAYQRQPF